MAAAYLGTFDDQGYRVVRQEAGPHAAPTERDLPNYPHYCAHRDWHNEAGLRQLALDLLIDTIGEAPHPVALRPQLGATVLYYARHVAAWIPHLHYAVELAPLARHRGFMIWSLSQGQIRTWLDDWLYEQHRRYSRQRHHGVYQGVPFADWQRLLAELAREFADIGAAALTVSQPVMVQYYLARYSPHELILHRCRALLSGRLAAP